MFQHKISYVLLRAVGALDFFCTEYCVCLCLIIFFIHQSIILETSLSGQLILLVLTTAKKSRITDAPETQKKTNAKMP